MYLRSESDVNDAGRTVSWAFPEISNDSDRRRCMRKKLDSENKCNNWASNQII